MNKVILSGRLTKDVSVNYTNDGLSIARFNVAVDRKIKKDSQQTADFISCVSFGKTAEFIEKYFSKGKGIELEGRIQTGSYDKDGAKVYTTDVVVEQVEFPKGGASDQKKSDAPAKTDDGFMNIPDDGMDDMPFN